MIVSGANFKIEIEIIEERDGYIIFKFKSVKLQDNELELLQIKLQDTYVNRTLKASLGSDVIEGNKEYISTKRSFDNLIVNQLILKGDLIIETKDAIFNLEYGELKIENPFV